MNETAAHCPSCSVRVPDGTGRFCPACGESMNAPPRLARSQPAAPADDAYAAGPPPGLPVGGPLDPAAPRPLQVRGTANGFLDIREAPVALPLAIAAIGAAVGALLWAGIAYATGMEIGYVAWALGGLAGGGCVLAGGRGPALAAAAALLAFLGIVGGRVGGTALLVDQQIDEVAGVFSPQAFAEIRSAALAENTEDPPASPLLEAMAEHLDDEARAELAELAEAERRFRERLREPGFTFEVWRAEQVATMRAQISLWDVLKETFGLLDVVFVLLGLSTAYGIVMRFTTAR